MFAQISAATTAPASTEALPVSVRRNIRSGVSICRAHAVFPENGPPPAPSASSAAAAAASSAAAADVSLTCASPSVPGRTGRGACPVPLQAY